MRGFRRLAGLLWLIALGAACDTTQPVLVDSQTVAISFNASSAGVPTYLVWDMFEDTNPADGMPDDVDGDGQPDMFLWCEAPGANDNTPPLSPTSIPLGFAIEIAVIRVGATQEEVLTGSNAALLNGNLTPYDTSSTNAFTFPKNPIQVMDNSVLRTFRFANQRRHTAGHRDVVKAVTNPLYELDPGTYGFDMSTMPPKPRGRCSMGDPGPAVIAGGTNPVEFELKKGETLIVRARRGNVPQALLPFVTSQPGLTAKTTVDGNPVAAGGNTQNQVGSQLRFTVTTR